jgi:MFS family permease
MLLPLVLSMAITSVVSGNIINLIGYYTPFILFASVTMSIGGGLLTTLNEDTSTAAWIGYQILFGIGAGCGMQQSMIAVQASFKRSRDIATGVTLMTFAQMLGGAVAISIAQSVFENKLSSSIQAADIPNADIKRILHTGATDLRSFLTGDDLTTVLRSYSVAIDGAFYVAMALAAVSILGGLAMEWHSVKGKSALNVIYLFR